MTFPRLFLAISLAILTAGFSKPSEDLDGATKANPYVNGLGMKFVPAGTKGVLFGVWETRVKDFRAFVKATGYDATKETANGVAAFTSEKEGERVKLKQAGGSWEDPRFPVGHKQDENHPVACVSYLDAEAFCQWLTKSELEAGRLPAGWSYRLPTDGEWSVACGPEEYPWGVNFPPGNKDGNYSGVEAMVGPLEGFTNEFVKAGRNDGWAMTAPVGGFLANRYGLYDMGGNVWEWCSSWYVSTMNDAETLAAVPILKDDGGGKTFRVVRGGSWRKCVRVNMRSAYRVRVDPRDRVDNFGFRVVLVPGKEGGTGMELAKLEMPKVPVVVPEVKVEATRGEMYVNGLGMKFVLAGTKGVLFGVWETRVKDFRAFVKATGYDAIKETAKGMAAFTLEKDGEGVEWKPAGGSWVDARFPAGHGQDENHPVVCVSYLDAEAFCEWLTKKERDGGRLPEGWRYRLPTDEEWTVACGPTEYPWGAKFPPGNGDGNYSGVEAMVGPLEGFSDEFSKVGRNDGGARTAPVGSYVANRYGLYDMGGNVREWCSSWYVSTMNDAATLAAEPNLNYDARKIARVVRGGSWRCSGCVYTRSAFRTLGVPRDRNDGFGFRVVLVGGGG